MNSVRTESDSLGAVQLEAAVYWGAQTQRSLEHFAAGGSRFVWPPAVIHAYGLLKRAAAQTNAEQGRLPAVITRLIVDAAGEVMDGRLDEHFPLRVFQTGSGTHTHMNVNEVIANRANELAGQPRGSHAPVHPNDHVNCGQSTNDTFPTVMHMVAVDQLHQRLFPAMDLLGQRLALHLEDWQAVVKTGRTHLQDAAPLTLAQETTGWLSQLASARQALEHCEPGLLQLALGGTAVGTGVNAAPEFAPAVIQRLADFTGYRFVQANNLFAALSGHEAMLQLSGALRTLAAALYKLASDIRLLGSGPFGGVGELVLPANEPGSSIMPGKVNPSQCEALTMVCMQVFGNDATVAFAASQGQLQLNANKPVILHNVLESMTLLADIMPLFARLCVAGLQPDTERIALHLEHNHMLATALSPHIGYEAAAAIVQSAAASHISLRQAALDFGVAAADYDAWVNPLAMTGTR